jgi:VanZ family protein
VSPTPAAPGAPTIAEQLRAWLPPVAVMVVIFLLSAQPGLRISDDPAVDTPFRRVAHVAAYGVLAILLLRPLGPFPLGRAALTAFVVAVLWAASDEMHQAIVPDRRGAVTDVVLDAAGALLGLTGAVAIARRSRRSARSGES